MAILLATASIPISAASFDTPNDGQAQVKGALSRALSLTPPKPSANLGGEFEHSEFWDEHGQLLRLAWEELERTTDYADDEKGEARSGDVRLDLGDVIDPAFARAVLAARADPSAENEDVVLSHWTGAVPSALTDFGVFRTRLFTADGLCLIRSHLDRASASGIPTRRPNGMNRHGVIIDKAVGGAVSLPVLTSFVEELVDEIVRPVGRALFPADTGKEDDAEYFAFTIRYSSDEDVELQEHRDASVFTLNVNLNLPQEGYGGSAVYFIDPGDKSKRYNVDFEPGMALLHRGALRHASLPIEEGGRQNLVIWLFGKGGDVRISPYANDEQMSVTERWEGHASSPSSWWKETL